MVQSLSCDSGRENQGHHPYKKKVSSTCITVKKINGIKREPNLLLIHLGPKNMATIIVYHTLVAQKKSPPPA